MDYLINIYRNDEYLFSLAANNTAWDNVMWHEIETVIDLAKNELLSSEDIKKVALSRSEYFYLSDDQSAMDNPTKIDIAKRTIHLSNSLEVYDINESNPYFDIVKHEDGNYAKYKEDGAEYPIISVTINDINLLNKLDLTFEEFEEIYKLIVLCVEVYNDTDYIVNNSKVMKLCFA